MKNIIFALAIIMSVFSCKNESKTDMVNDVSQDLAYASFGDKINVDNALTTFEMATKFDNMSSKDTLVVKLKSTINEVCTNKGCWMKLDMGNEREVMVRFKDYGFFVPLDATGEVIINGKAYVSETSVEELKHYAEDAGKSSEEIALIVKAEKTFSFEANGVLLKQ
ncbi:DUF4920 domain-containing protein [Flavobacteriaceae bacterium]|jgi:hypothetical protein|nr:DUF4920 domain-containing protein [Flavobacteriaceae bacterium]